MEPVSPQTPLDESLSMDALTDLVLRQDQYPLRSQAMRLLADRVLQEPRQLALMAGLLRDETPSVRRRAAQTLGVCGSAARSMLGELCQAIRIDPMWTVREAAAHAVRVIAWPVTEDFEAGEVAGQLLESALSDREPLVREAAIHGLAASMKEENSSGTSELREALNTAMAHPHSSRRCRAITAICRLPGAEDWGRSAILFGLKDSHWKVRRTTAQELVENPQLVFTLPPKGILPEFIKRLFDQHPVVQAAVREALARLASASKDEMISRIMSQVTSKPSASETLLGMLEELEFSQAAESQFRDLCQRRRDWHLQNLREAIPGAPTDTPDGMARELLALAARWQAAPKLLAQNPEAARRAAEEKEAAWLLARGLEIVFAALEESQPEG